MDRKKTDSSRHRSLDRRDRVIFAGYAATVLVMTVSTETCFAANDPNPGRWHHHHVHERDPGTDHRVES